MIEFLMVIEFTREEGKEYGAEKAAILHNIRSAGGEAEISEIITDLSYAIPKRLIRKHIRKLEKYGLLTVSDGNVILE